MKVCRVCLAMRVKMYHMPKHKLSDMYQQVTGIKINLEDKLPKMICWECVARLSSANKFIEKAVKTQWILLKKLNGDNITMSDIASIDRAQYQLESTLRLKYNEINITDKRIQRESDITDDDHDASNVELLIFKYEDSEEEDVEKLTVKSELLDITEQPEEAELQVPKPILIKENLSDEEVTTDSVSNASESSEEENPAVHKDREVCEPRRKELKDFGVTPLRLRSKVLKKQGTNRNKELRVVLEDVMLNLGNQNIQDYFKEITNSMSCSKAQSINNKGTVIQPTINKGTLTNTDNMDTDSTDTIEAATVIQNNPKVTSNIDVTHYDAESSKTVFICDICNKSFPYKKYLKQHIQRQGNLFNCTYCQFKTCGKLNLIRHVNIAHIKNKYFNCSHCSYETYNKRSLNNHVTAKHIDKTIYHCTYCTSCTYKTYFKNNLASHIENKHIKSTVLNCSYCSYTTCVKSSLSKHINTKHTKKTVYNCSYCGHKTYEKTSLSRHINTKHTKNTVYNCSYCSYKAYNKTTLDNHVNAKHTKKTVINCSYCSYKAYHKSNYLRHVNSQHTKMTVYNCSYCSLVVYEKKALDVHVNTVHTKKTVFHCSHCDYKSYCKNTLSRHVNSKHTKSIVYNCTYCSYVAYDNSSLRIHVNGMHTKNVVFYCAHCDYKSYTKSRLIKHLRSQKVKKFKHKKE